jgi:hypothetical protein
MVGRHLSPALRRYHPYCDTQRSGDGFFPVYISVFLLYIKLNIIYLRECFLASDIF